MSWGSPEELKDGNQEKGVQRGTFDIQLADGSTMPDEVVFRASFNEAGKPVEHRTGDYDPQFLEGGLSSTESNLDGLALEVRIPIDKTRFANLKREYAINKSIEAGGQKINVVRATVDPLRIAVEMTYDEANSKQIFDPVDIHLTDDKGAEWRYIGGSAVETNRDIIYFESSYFHAPKELYLEGTLFRALDKNRLSVVINTESKQLLNSPDDKLTLKDIQKTDRNTRITLALKGHSEKDRMGYNFLDPKFKDAEGRGHEMNNNGEVVTWSSSSGSFEEQNSYYYLKNETYPQPLTFQINAYPAYLEASYRIRIQ
jgi:hypothetical protein